MNATPLFDWASPPKISGAEAQWRIFHAENPQVYELFKRFTFQVISAGRDRYSSDAICHRIRWHTTIEARGDTFKINDHHTAFYARLFMDDHPQHRGFFETRVQRSMEG